MIVEPCEDIIALSKQNQYFPQQMQHLARENLHKTALILLNERGAEICNASRGDVLAQAESVASQLIDQFAPQERVLLAIDSPVEFLVVFVACHLGQLIPVSVVSPRRRKMHEATVAIKADCRPCCVVCSDRHYEVFAREASTTRNQVSSVIPVTTLLNTTYTTRNLPRSVNGTDLALIQYTSGSTATPKGVMVNHDNLAINLTQITRTMATDSESCFVSWIPLFHDMGLILSALHSLFIGARCVFMPPAAFTQRPLSWLTMVSRYGATVSGAPNFAYDLCVQQYRADVAKDLDLSRWTLAFNAAEPVRVQTIDRFSELYAAHGFDPQVMYPCYGLAEATVFATGNQVREGLMSMTLDYHVLSQGYVHETNKLQNAHRVVGCGRSIAAQRMCIVDPTTRERLGDDCVGEIWLSGPNIAQGYWENTDATEQTFHGRLNDEDDQDSFLRTGDIGFIRNGQIYVTGRIKDLMIVRGRNLYPQDVEKAVESAHPSLRPNGSAAFAVDEDNNLKIVVVAEVNRVWRKTLDVHDLIACARKAVSAEFDIRLDTLVLVRPGSLPKTTSGKQRRAETRQRFLDGTLSEVNSNAHTIEDGRRSSCLEQTT